MLDSFFWPIVGGALIGLSSTLLLLMIGRIAGISGILWNAIKEDSSDRSWRWVFIIGLIAGTWAFHFISGEPYPLVNDNMLLAGIAGLIAGVGVKIGNGCTSGHGVCGIGRLSTRSIFSTVVFMLTAIITVYVVNLVTGGLS